MRTFSVVADVVKQIWKAQRWLWVTGKEQPQMYSWAGWSSCPLTPDPSIMKVSRCLVYTAQKGKRCILLFCLTKAPLMFSWNTSSVVWFTHGCAAKVLKCRFQCSDHSEITVSLHLFCPSSGKIVPCALLWTHQQSAIWCLAESKPLLLNSGLSGLLWHPEGASPTGTYYCSGDVWVSEGLSGTVGMRLYRIHQFSLHWLLHLVVKNKSHLTLTSVTVV